MCGAAGSSGWGCWCSWGGSARAVGTTLRRRKTRAERARTPADFGASSPDGCAGVVEGASGDYFFTAAVSGPGSGRCGGGSNDIFGCGTLGDPTSIGSCNPLNRFLSSSNDAAPWDLGGGSSSEASAAVKSGPADGGVLCCRD